jgi:hypothetical protein
MLLKNYYQSIKIHQLQMPDNISTTSTNVPISVLTLTVYNNYFYFYGANTSQIVEVNILQSWTTIPYTHTYYYFLALLIIL